MPGTERIDHGYAVADDPALTARCRAAGTVFTCCRTTTTCTTRHRDLAAPDHRIRRICEAGLTVTIHSDDPTMFGTTLAQEYLVAHRDLGFRAADIRAAIFARLAARWLPAADKARMAADWAAGIDALLTSRRPPLASTKGKARASRATRAPRRME